MCDLLKQSPAMPSLRDMRCIKLLETNSEAAKYGLGLTQSEALQVLEAAEDALAENGRVELSADILGLLAIAVCSSPYVDAESYAATLGDFIEVFYYGKTATNDELADDDLISFIIDCYNNRCHGSMVMLYNELDCLVRETRREKLNPILHSDSEDSGWAEK